MRHRVLQLQGASVLYAHPVRALCGLVAAHDNTPATDIDMNLGMCEKSHRAPSIPVATTVRETLGGRPLRRLHATRYGAPPVTITKYGQM
jgi:hypothetical protein